MPLVPLALLLTRVTLLAALLVTGATAHGDRVALTLARDLLVALTPRHALLLTFPPVPLALLLALAPLPLALFARPTHTQAHADVLKLAALKHFTSRASRSRSRSRFGV